MKKNTNISIIEIQLKQLRIQKAILGVVCVFMAVFIIFGIFCIDRFQEFKSNISDITAAVNDVSDSNIQTVLNDINNTINSEDMQYLFDKENVSALKDITQDMQTLKSIDIEKFSQSINTIKELMEPIKIMLNGTQ